MRGLSTAGDAGRPERRTPSMAFLPLLVLASLLVASTAAAQIVPIEERKGARREAWPVRTSLIGQYRSRVAYDEDPANDQSLRYLLRARGKVIPRGTVVFGTGMTQRFVAEQDDSAFRLTDSFLGFEYATPIALSDDYTLMMTHVLWGFLPTSRASRNQDLLFAPVWQLRTAMQVAPGLVVGVVPYFRYRFHSYAERAGLNGDMNTQMDMGVTAGLDYTAFASKTFGALTIGGSASSAYARSYESRDTLDTPTSDPAAWSQFFSWETHAFYNPLAFLLVGLSLEQNAPVLRDGVVNLVPFHRDETEWTLTVGVTL